MSSAKLHIVRTMLCVSTLLPILCLWWQHVAFNNPLSLFGGGSLNTPAASGYLEYFIFSGFRVLTKSFVVWLIVTPAILIGTYTHKRIASAAAAGATFAYVFSTVILAVVLLLYLPLVFLAETASDKKDLVMESSALLLLVCVPTL